MTFLTVKIQNEVVFKICKNISHLGTNLSSNSLKVLEKIDSPIIKR